MSETKIKWNPRYVAFAKANGRTAEEQSAVDAAGTHTLEFQLWIGRKWQKFAEAHGCKVSYWLRIWDQDEFDKWLFAEGRSL